MKSAMLSRVLITLAALVLVGTGCKKLKSTRTGTTVTVTPEPIDNNVGGLGGRAVLSITPNHDGLNIDSCLVYIKYNAAVVPRDGNYDDSAWAISVDGKPVASFKNLKTGNYYLYGVGWDIIRSEKVRGGLPFTIVDENKSTEHRLVLPIQDYQ